MENLQALREALIARQGQMGGGAPGAEPQGLSPEGGPPLPPEAGMSPALQGGMPADAGGGGLGMGQIPPEMLLEAQKLKIKEELKRVRMQETDMEIQEILRSRMADIEEEAAGLFESGAKK